MAEKSRLLSLIIVSPQLVGLTKRKIVGTGYKRLVASQQLEPLITLAVREFLCS